MTLEYPPRTIKFRYLWKDKWYYIDFYRDNLRIKFSEYESRKTSILFEFTGKKDKKGKEIYEGDILKIKDEKMNYAVIWNEFSLCFQLQNFGFLIHSLPYSGDIKILGNELETPKLLKEEYEYTKRHEEVLKIGLRGENK